MPPRWPCQFYIVFYNKIIIFTVCGKHWINNEGGDESDIQADEPLIDVQPEPEELEDGADEVPVSLDDFESRLQRLRDHRERHGGN